MLVNNEEQYWHYGPKASIASTCCFIADRNATGDDNDDDKDDDDNDDVDDCSSRMITWQRMQCS